METVKALQDATVPRGTGTTSGKTGGKDLVKLIALWLIAMFVFLFFYSRALFLLLMAQYDFFSYDLFLVGGTAMTTFYLTAELIVVVSSLALFGFLLPLMERRFKKPPYSMSPWMFGTINVCFWFLLLILALTAERWEWWNHLPKLVVTGLVALHLSMLLFAPRTWKMKSSFVLVIMLSGFAFFWQQPMVALLSQGLKAYGVGGEIAVELHYRNANQDKGRLVLLSPQHAYVILGGKRKISVIGRDVIQRIDVLDEP